MKMKKIISLVLILALSLSLCACGGDSSKSKGELLEVAKDYTSWKEFNGAVDNKPKAENLVGEVGFIQGYIDKIESNYCIVFPTTSNSNASFLHVYLPKNELANLNVDDPIVAVGIIDSTETEDYNFLGHTIERVYFEIKNAYLISPSEDIE